MYNSSTTGLHRVARPKKRTGAFLFTAASVLIAGFAGLFVFQTIEQAQPAKARPIVKVLVAAHDVPLGRSLTAEDVALVDWPQENAIFRAFSTPEEVLGRVVTRPLVQGETISDQRLAPREAGQGLGALIPKGMRAQALRINDESGVAGFLQPGDFVDVVMILRGPEGLVSKTSLQNIQVIAVGEQYQQNIERGEGATKAPVVTVLVRPEQATRLAIAATHGQVVLTLRNGYDTEEIATAGFSGENARLTLVEEEPAPAVSTKRPAPRAKAGDSKEPTQEAPTPPVEEPGLPQVIVGGKIVTTGDRHKKNTKTILVPML